MKESQTTRLLRWLRENPGTTSIEITMALRIVNVTGRISDLRIKHGHDIEDVVVDGVHRYYVREPSPVELVMFFAEAS